MIFDKDERLVSRDGHNMDKDDDEDENLDGKARYLFDEEENLDAEDKRNFGK